MKAVFALISLLVGPVWGSSDEHLETVLAVTQCRASCLDQFSHVIRTEDNCQKESNCFMCWETCEMLIANFKIWGPICAVPDICIPGCQKACDFIEGRKNESSVTLPPIILRSVYEPHTDRVSLEWVPDRDLESESTVLYSVLLKDEKNKWYQVTQTTSHVVHIKRGLLNRNSTIRVVAANATSRVSDSETSYLDTSIMGSIVPTYGKNASKLWKPQLESMVQSETSLGLLATIIWPVKADKYGPVQYEVSWNVIDDSMEITGHLYTSNNVAVLTLWPNSLYSVQVNCYAADNGLQSQSEPLIIDTKNSHVIKEITPFPSCTTGERLAINAFAFLSAFFITFLIFAFIWALKRRKSHSMEEDNNIKEIPKSAFNSFKFKIVRSPAHQSDSGRKPLSKDIVTLPVDIESQVFHVI